jgi:hypothetical protein
MLAMVEDAIILSFMACGLKVAVPHVSEIGIGRLEQGRLVEG